MTQSTAALRAGRRVTLVYLHRPDHIDFGRGVSKVIVNSAPEAQNHFFSKPSVHQGIYSWVGILARTVGGGIEFVYSRFRNRIPRINDAQLTGSLHSRRSGYYIRVQISSVVTFCSFIIISYDWTYSTTIKGRAFHCDADRQPIP